MSRNEEFSHGQVHHISHEQLADLRAGDYDETRMRDIVPALQWDWDNSGEHPGDPEYVHSNEYEHGGPRPYIEHLKSDISKRGMDSPIDVSNGAVVDGHHRAAAAMELKMDKIPVVFHK